MIPKRAIEFSIAGGWVSEYPQEGTWLANYENYRAALDPTFWQALGKALGWRTGMTFADIFDGRELSGWEYHAHRFYDLVLQGKDTDDFWQQLLN